MRVNDSLKFFMCLGMMFLFFPGYAFWTMVCGGDLMLNGISALSNPFEGLKKTFKGADVVIANLEIPLTSFKIGTSRKSLSELREKKQFILKADPAHAPYLKETGFQLLSLGNNHAMDYGREGLFEMLYLLQLHHLEATGAGSMWHATHPVKMRTREGKIVGLISYLAFMSKEALYKCSPVTASLPGVAALDFGCKVGDQAKQRLYEIVKEAKKECDFLVVALHWGHEKKTIPTAYQVDLGRAWVEAGADCILGSHPHVLQGAEIYLGKPVFYSLGNLISPRPSSTALFKCCYQDQKLTGIQMIPCQIQSGKVNVDESVNQNQVKSKFIQLCKEIQCRYPKSGSTLPKIF